MYSGIVAGNRLNNSRKTVLIESILKLGNDLFRTGLSHFQFYEDKKIISDIISIVII